MRLADGSSWAMAIARAVICESCNQKPAQWELTSQALVDAIGANEEDPLPFRVCGDCLPETLDLVVLIHAELEEM